MLVFSLSFLFWFVVFLFWGSCAVAAVVFFVRRRGAYTYNTDKQAKGDRDFEKN
jgi:hypothetical protein